MSTAITESPRPQVENSVVGAATNLEEDHHLPWDFTKLFNFGDDGSPSSENKKDEHQETRSTKKNKTDNNNNNNNDDDAKDHDPTASLLAHRMSTQLTMEDKQRANYDIYGLASIPDETPERVHEWLSEMDTHLAKLAKSGHGSHHAYYSNDYQYGHDDNNNNGDNVDNIASNNNNNQTTTNTPTNQTSTATTKITGLQQAMDIDYEYVLGLRMAFLRAEYWRPYQAAQRMARYFDLKRRYFPLTCLARDLWLADLPPDDLEVWKTSGFAQILEQRDRAGRPVIFVFGKLQFQHKLETIVRFSFVCCQMMIRDVDVQRMGVVNIYYGLGQPIWIDGRAHKLIETWFSLPLRGVSRHVCYDKPTLAPLANIITMVVDSIRRLRLTTHRGSHQECLYNLMTYGISQDSIPITISPDGNSYTVQTDYHQSLIEALQLQEEQYRIQHHDQIQQKQQELLKTQQQMFLNGMNGGDNNNNSNTINKDLASTNRDSTASANTVDIVDMLQAAAASNSLLPLNEIDTLPQARDSSDIMMNEDGRISNNSNTSMNGIRSSLLSVDLGLGGSFWKSLGLGGGGENSLRSEDNPPTNDNGQQQNDDLYNNRTSNKSMGPPMDMNDYPNNSLMLMTSSNSTSLAAAAAAAVAGFDEVAQEEKLLLEPNNNSQQQSTTATSYGTTATAAVVQPSNTPNVANWNGLSANRNDNGGTYGSTTLSSAMGLTMPPPPPLPSTKLATKAQYKKPPTTVVGDGGMIIIIPGPDDVIMGRGRHNKNKPGNRKLQTLLEEYAPRYEAADKFEKTVLAEMVLKQMTDAGSRFLVREGTSSMGTKNNNKGIWIEVTPEKARDKIAHDFRNLRRNKAATATAATATAGNDMQQQQGNNIATASSSKEKRRLSTMEGGDGNSKGGGMFSWFQ